MAKGWSDDDAVSTQISGSIADEVARVRSRLPTGESLSACEECDAPIPEGRQRAVPGVRLCVACQVERDKAEGARPAFRLSPESIIPCFEAVS